MASGQIGNRVFFDDKEWRDFIRDKKFEISRSSNVLKVAYATRGFRDIIEHFKSEEGPNDKWKGLAPSTLRRRKKGRRRRRSKILQDTGNLRQSFSRTNSKFVDNQSILIFNNAPYSGVHDSGSKRKNIPARPFMYFTDDAWEDMAKIVLDRLI